MKIGVFGGTFNPIHNGHINAIMTSIDSLDLDKLILMPANVPPHKSENNLVSAADRIDMCKIATRGIKKVFVSDMETKRPGKSFTIDTLLELKDRYKPAELFLVVGTDMFLSFETWNRFKDILKIATICVVPRNFGDILRIKKYSEFLKSYGAVVRVINCRAYPISSSIIREKLRNDEGVSELLPSDVIEYIEKSGLYADEISSGLIDKYKPIIRNRMGQKRYIHSILVAKEAEKLAKIYKIDTQKAKTAGILHDVTKETPVDEQLQMINSSGIIMNKVERSCNRLWHAVSATVYLEKVLGIKDKDILNAIRYHTTGRVGMSKLEKIIFVADATSADRRYAGVTRLRRTAYLDLDKAVINIISFTLTGLASKKYLISPDTFAAYNDMLMNLQK